MMHNRTYKWHSDSGQDREIKENVKKIKDNNVFDLLLICSRDKLCASFYS